MELILTSKSMNVKTALLFLVLLPVCWSCKERFDKIILTPPVAGEYFYVDTAFQGSVPAKQEKRVLIEDFTGVKCTGCPNAQKEIVKIEAANEGKISVISYHVTQSFAEPLPESKYNFRTTSGEHIFSLLGSAGSLPIGAIDRMKFSGEMETLISFTKWVNGTNTQLAKPSLVNIVVDSMSYDVFSRFFVMDIRITYSEVVTSSQALSIVLSESGIIDVQDGLSGKIYDYEHNHVFRKVTQPFDGLSLEGPGVPGKTYIIKLAMRIEEDWNPENCTVTVLVHSKSATDKEVYQVMDFKVK
ncbi:MAG: Omp28-related outer membrane protein [Bacteroidota bacterium]|nr:Omp28-related outer membrane protein [Bacteroidota bacterium]